MAKDIVIRVGAFVAPLFFCPFLSKRQNRSGKSYRKKAPYKGADMLAWQLFLCKKVIEKL
nr:hypothetical protein [Aerococcus mictus]